MGVGVDTSDSVVAAVAFTDKCDPGQDDEGASDCHTNLSELILVGTTTMIILTKIVEVLQPMDHNVWDRVVHCHDGGWTTTTSKI